MEGALHVDTRTRMDDPVGESEQLRIVCHHQNYAAPLFRDGGQYRHDR